MDLIEKIELSTWLLFNRFIKYLLLRLKYLHLIIIHIYQGWQQQKDFFLFLAFSWTINYTDGRKHTLCSAISAKKGSSQANAESASSFSSTTITGERSARQKLSSSRRAQLNPSERKKVSKYSNEIFTNKPPLCQCKYLNR